MSGEPRKQKFYTEARTVGTPDQRPAWMSDKSLLPRTPPPLPKDGPHLPRRGDR